MDDEELRVYNIPNNYLDEGRILNGMFKTRGFIEGLILAVLVGIWPILFYQGELQTKITIVAICALPPFFLGVNGFNGDPLSVSVLNFISWVRSDKVYLYNSNTRALKDNVIDVRDKTVTPADMLLDKIDAFKKKMSSEKKDELIEGTYEFATEEGISHLLIDDSKTEKEDSTLNFVDITVSDMINNDGTKDYNLSELLVNNTAEEQQVKRVNLRVISSDSDQLQLNSEEDNPDNNEQSTDSQKNEAPAIDLSDITELEPEIISSKKNTNSDNSNDSPNRNDNETEEISIEGDLFTELTFDKK